MGHFYPDEALSHMARRDGGSLEGIVSLFPPKLKQAMYAAAAKGVGLASSRWVGADGGPGCAFNEAGKVVDAPDAIVSVGTAAHVFGISEGLVQRFIRKWDSMHIETDSGRANLLKKVLTDVGLTTPVHEIDHADDGSVVVISDVMYRGTMTEFIEALDKVSSVVDLGFEVDEAVAADDLCKLLLPA